MFRKQLLYLTNDRLTAYTWERGALAGGRAFDNDEAGREALSSHLAGAPEIPVYVLADLIEEDFQRENLPHVLGRTRHALVQRRLGQLYRDTPYRQATLQGREKEGRKDDRALFSALTNAELITPWVDAILEQQAALAGIYSPTLLSAALVKKFDLACDHLLLVSFQSGGLRQSYFQGPYLKFSRLTPLADHSPLLSSSAAEEIARTQQFLSSSRLLSYGKPLDVAILAPREGLPQLQAVCRDTPALVHRFLALEDAAQRLGLKTSTRHPLGDQLFLGLLGSGTPAGNYALPAQTRFFRLRQARIALYVLSFASLAGGLLWAGSDVLSSLEFRQQSQQLALETRTALTRQQAIMRSLPPTATSPANMKAAVDIDRMISHNAPNPVVLLGIVSRALDTLPQIRINQLHWQASEGAAASDPANLQQPAARPMPQPGPGGAEPAPPAVLIGIPQKPHQNLLIEGEVAPFQNDYRAALESVRQLADELRKTKLLQVEITQTPLDIKPAAKLQGTAGTEDAAALARFAMRLVMKPDTTPPGPDPVENRSPLVKGN